MTESKTQKVETYENFSRCFTQPIKNREPGNVKSPPEWYDDSTHRWYNNSFNKPIQSGDLPTNLTHLCFGNFFNQPLQNNVLPTNLTHLSFGNLFNLELEKIVLPTNLTHLSFGHKFNQEINVTQLPTNLTHLSFGHSFNQPIFGVDDLRFGTNYRDSTEVSIKLTHLSFGQSFIQPVTAVPKTLTHIKLSQNYLTRALMEKLLKKTTLTEITIVIPNNPPGLITTAKSFTETLLDSEFLEWIHNVTTGDTDSYIVFTQDVV